MNEKELRIGNYVNSDLYKEPIEVHSICSLTKDIFNIQTGEIPLTSLTAIPLTEEWLLKFGYIKLGSNYIIQGHSIWVCNDLLMCDKNGIVLKSVHQLQNLYFALTGKELTL